MNETMSKRILKSSGMPKPAKMLCKADGAEWRAWVTRRNEYIVNAMKRGLSYDDARTAALGIVGENPVKRKKKAKTIIEGGELWSCPVCGNEYNSDDNKKICQRIADATR